VGFLPVLMIFFDQKTPTKMLKNKDKNRKKIEKDV
jgi:hypothetical protein